MTSVSRLVAPTLVFSFLLTASPAQAQFNCDWVQGDGNWSDSSQWTSCNSTFPNNNASTFNANKTVSGTATLTENITINDFTLSNGLVDSGFSLNINGVLDWSAGGFTGIGTSTAAGNATVGGGVLQDVTGGHTLVTQGTTTWSNGAANNGRFRTGVGATIRNDGIWQDQNAFATRFSNDFGGAASTFVNNGTYTKTGSALVEFRAGVMFDNNGTVNVQNGTLSLEGGGTSANATYNISSGALLVLGGTGTIDGSSTISGSGALEFGGANGTMDIDAAINVGEGMTVSQGTHNLNGSVLTGSNLTATGGTLNFNGMIMAFASSVNVSGSSTVDLGTNTVSTTDYEQTGGTVRGTGSLTVTGAGAIFSAGQLNDAGTTTFNDTLSVGGGVLQDVTGGHTLVTQGTTTWSNVAANNGRFRTGVGATIRNDGIWLDQNAFATRFSNDFGGAASTFINDGTYTKSGSALVEFRAGVNFNNNGTVNVQNGTLSLEGGGTSANATYNVSSGALLVLGGTGSIDSNSSISGAGALEFGAAGGTMDIDASIDMGEGTTVSQGTHNLNGPILNTGSSLVATGGTLNFNNTITTFASSVNVSGSSTVDLGTNTVSTTDYEQTGGTVRGTGSLTVTGAGAIFSAGQLNDASTTTFNDTLSVGGGVLQDVTGGHTLVTQGVTTWSNVAANNGRFRTGVGATIRNDGTWLDQNAFATRFSNDFGGAASTFINDGTYTKTGSALVEFRNGVNFDNPGTVDVQNGTLDLESTVIQHVGDTLTGGTWIVRNDGTLELTLGSSVDIVTNAGDVTLDGPNSSFARINPLTTNDGAFRLHNSRVFNAVSSFTTNGELEVLNSGTFNGSTLLVTDTGSITGNSTVSAAITVNGTVAPGPDTDSLILDGNTDFNTALLDIDIASTSAFDLVTVQGSADFTSSAIDFTFVGGFVPIVGDTWDFFIADSLSGFDEISFTINGGPNTGFLLSMFTQGQGAMDGLRLQRIPLPPTMWLMIAPLIGMIARARRRKTS